MIGDDERLVMRRVGRTDAMLHENEIGDALVAIHRAAPPGGPASRRPPDTECRALHLGRNADLPGTAALRHPRRQWVEDPPGNAAGVVARALGADERVARSRPKAAWALLRPVRRRLH